MTDLSKSLSAAEAARLVQRNAKEHAAIIDGIGKATITWSMLEGNLSTIFSYLAFGAFHPEVAGVIFYSPNNFETRLRLVDDLVVFRFSEKGEKHLKRWVTIKGRIQKKQSTRNAIAHGTIVIANNFVRLSPALFDTLRMRSKAKPRQLPGMSANDIRDFTTAVGNLVNVLNVFSDLVILLVGTADPHQPKRDLKLPEVIAQLDSLIESQSMSHPNPRET